MSEEKNEPKPINLHLDIKDVGGVWANFAGVKHSEYEFTIDFARLDFTPEGANGVVVSRVNLSPMFVTQLIQALEENWNQYAKRTINKETGETI